MLADGIVRYSFPESFERAVESVCSALRNKGMRIAGQLDVSRRFQCSFGIVLPPCKVLFVLPEPGVLDGAEGDPQVAAFLPLHIVISSHDAHSEIQVQNRLQAECPESSAYAPVVEAQRQVRSAIEAIAARASILA